MTSKVHYRRLEHSLTRPAITDYYSSCTLPHTASAQFCVVSQMQQTTFNALFGPIIYVAISNRIIPLLRFQLLSAHHNRSIIASFHFGTTSVLLNIASRSHQKSILDLALEMWNSTGAGLPSSYHLLPRSPTAIKVDFCSADHSASSQHFRGLGVIASYYMYN